MYHWPWRRFEAMFKRHLLRKAREELRQLRDLRVAAVDANMNWDSKENRQAKQERIAGLMDAHEEAVRQLYASPDEPSPEQQALEDDPLFAPVLGRSNQLRAQAEQPIVAEAGAGRDLLEAVT